MIRLFTSFLLLASVLNTHGQIAFQSIAAESGINHAHTSVIYMGGGVAFFDYNNDGFDDIFLTGGSNPDKLYRNLGNLQFNDMTRGVGLYRENKEQSMGVAIGDINNDGFKDIFVYYGVGDSNRLYLNNEGERFIDITESAGLENFDWSMGASFGDVNLDGLLDLYVINWVEDFDAVVDNNGNTIGFNHTGYMNNLYLNNGNNTFSEVTDQYNAGGNKGCGLAVLFTDYNNDSYPDIYIANDFGAWVVPNTLLKNEYPIQTFTNQSASSGLNAGIYGMGIAEGDYDRNGYIDYYTTNIGRNVLYKNNGNGLFEDVTDYANVANDSSGNLNTTSWGTVFADLDNDGYEDLLVSNGYVPTAPFIGTAISDPNKLYLNLGNGKFEDVTEKYGIGDPNISRGVATSDIDNDGDLDFLFTYISTDILGKSENENVLFYVNNTINENGWVKFKLEGSTNARDAYNTRVKLYTGDEAQIRELYSGSSHGSQNSSIVHIGLGDKTHIDSLTIIWPGGSPATYYDLDINKTYFVKEDSQQIEIMGCMDESFENYDPTATVNYGCRQSVVASLNEAHKAKLEIFPNPGGNQVSFTSSYDLPKNAKVEFYNSCGTLCMTKMISKSKRFINVSNLRDGLYFVQILTKSGIKRVKFIKN